MSSDLGPTTTTDDVLDGKDLSGRRYLVTGVSAGLGIETARALAAHGAEVVGAVRDIGKARAATAGFAEFTARPCLTFVELDLADLASVRRCTDSLLEKAGRFDAVIANAAIMAPPLGRTKDGFELQFGTNHLGHFVLINRLVPLLGPGSRVIVVSSAGHRFGDVNLDDPNFEKTEYTPFGGYGRSKTANALFALEFDRRHKASGIRAASVHPGVIQTELSRHLPEEVKRQAAQMAEAARRGEYDGPLTMKSVEQGAATQIWAAVTAPPEEIGGRYCEDCNVAELSENDENGRKGVRPYAQAPDRAQALWRLSEEMVRERF